MKTKIMSWFFCVLLLGFAVCEASVLDKVVAVINDDIITASDFEAAFVPIKRQIHAAYKDNALNEQLTQAKRQVLERMIDDLLILQDAKEKKLTVTQEDIEDYINKVKLKFSSEDIYNESLLKQGLTPSSFKEKIKDQLLMKKYRMHVVGRSIDVYPHELLDFFQNNKEKYIEHEAVKASQIYVLKGGDLAFARDKIEEIFDQISNGEDFEKIFKQYSQGSDFIKSSDLGFFERGQMIKEIEDIVFISPIGTITNIIESNTGFHIVKVTARKEQNAISFDDVQEEIKSLVFNRKAENKYRGIINKLKEDAYIEIKSDFFESDH